MTTSKDEAHILVTGSSGRLGNALCLFLRNQISTGKPSASCDTIEERVNNFVVNNVKSVTGIDICEGKHTDVVMSIEDKAQLKGLMTSKNINVVINTAALHRPHIPKFSRQKFIDVNVSGTQNLLELAVELSVKAFLLTSSTSTFGHALKSKEGTTWITEETVPQVKNIYGSTKISAEMNCNLMYQLYNLPTIILKVSRFFPEPDFDDVDDASNDINYDNKMKALEFLNRRIDLQDLIYSHLLATYKLFNNELSHDCFIISAKPPFNKENDLKQLSTNADEVLQKYYPNINDIFNKFNWTLPTSFDRVYDITKAEEILEFRPKYNFTEHLIDLQNGKPFSELSRNTIPSNSYIYK